MAEFELDEAAVAQAEAKLFETGETVNNEALRARESALGSAGAWQGAANVAATNKQVGEFADSVNKLHEEINHIAEACGLGRRAVMAEDQFNEEKFLTISPDSPYAKV